MVRRIISVQKSQISSMHTAKETTFAKRSNHFGDNNVSFFIYFKSTFFCRIQFYNEKSYLSMIQFNEKAFCVFASQSLIIAIFLIYTLKTKVANFYIQRRFHVNSDSSNIIFHHLRAAFYFSVQRNGEVFLKNFLLMTLMT